MHARSSIHEVTSPPISVLYFENEEVRGGVEEHVLTLLRGLDRRLFRLHLACPPRLLEHLEGDLPPDVEVIPLKVAEPYHLGSMLRLARILRSRRIDILHSHAFYASLCASPVGWLCRVPLTVETPHNREAWRKGWFKGRYFADRMVSRFVDHYIAVSQANARYLVETKGFPERKIRVIYPGSDLSRFDPNRRVPPGLAASAGIEDGDPVLVFVGRLEPQKGHAVLLDAMTIVRREIPCARLVCIGGGALRAELEEKTCALGLEDCVRFLGYVPDMRDWLALADLTVLPSFFEGLPVTPIESLACERAVVATEVDGTPEVVINGKTGITVPPGDAKSLAEAICLLLKQPDLRRKLAIEGRRWVLENFSSERMIERTQQFYLEIWEARQRGIRSGVKLTASPDSEVPEALPHAPAGAPHPPEY